MVSNRSAETRRAPNALLVVPRFPNSFWSLETVCEAWGARCPGPPLGLITVAALLPSTWKLRLVDRNAEVLRPEDLEWADLVMTGGMITQRQDALSMIERCRSLRKPIVVGGPDATSSPDIYQRADFLVLGEAEGLIEDFIAAWSVGATDGVFEGPKFQADVTSSPPPRFDLLDLANYLYVGVQFSRGCPFNCEFCDIIELYGRVPRTKSNEQMLAELETLYRMGYRGHVNFADDNLIGNKKALKRFLPALCEWQRQHRYPFRFSTEASVNMADDAALLEMLREANFYTVFVGIESTDAHTLVATRKTQNTRRSLVESIRKIHAAGMFVIGGFIVGFDSEKEGAARTMIDAIDDLAIPVCSVAQLTALPNTQLARRLEREGRLLPLDKGLGGFQSVSGLNFATLRPRAEILADVKTILEAIYAPAAYFGRVRKACHTLDRRLPISRFPLREVSHWPGFCARVAWYMTVRRPEFRREFWRTLAHGARNGLGIMEYVWTMAAFYMHLGTFMNVVIEDLDRRIMQADNDFSVEAPAEPELRLA